MLSLVQVRNLMASGDNDYVEFDVCLACQRVQNDLFEYKDKPKKGQKVWTLEEKLADLEARVIKLHRLVHELNIAGLPSIVEALAETDRCLPGLVRELERSEARCPCPGGR